MQRDRRGHLILYIWDYFYLARVPQPGDEKAWAVIERATGRIRENECSLDPPNPVDLRLRSARRTRQAIRVTMRQIEQLSVKPDPWVIEELAELAAMADNLIATLADDASRIVLD